MLQRLTETSEVTSFEISVHPHRRNRSGNFFKNPLVIVVSLFALLAFLTSAKVFIHLLAFYSGLLSGAVFLLICILAGKAILQAPAAPLSAMIRMAVRLPLRVYMTVLFALPFLASFTTFKISIPAIMPFYADPWLANLDVWMHGTDPWRLARSLPAATSIVVDFFYAQAWFGVALGSVISAAIIEPPAQYKRLIWSSILVYILLGVVAATAMSSVGPVFYDHFYPGGRFHDLIAMLTDPTQKMTMSYLYDAYASGTPSVGTGISAMPSIHVAVAVLTAWYLTSRGTLWAVAGWAFAAIILFGSVYTGWHYACDGYVSAIAATAIWLSLSRIYRLPLTAQAAQPALVLGSQTKAAFHAIPERG